ncbi:TITAN-like protein isoform X2 [Ananas comosus]|nr:TITAN-like protein isoform X2 [Ananas comosus]XP_020088490.1 TITAN-like protein isoform X2 [Ananas comosus]
MDRVDSFRVSEVELLKWEKGCEALKSAAQTLSEGPIGPSPGPSKSIDIQNELTSNNMDTYAQSYIQSFSSNVSHCVMPLQSLTNEEFSGTSNTGQVPYFAPFTASVQEYSSLQYTHASQSWAGSYQSNQPASLCNNNGKASFGWSARRGMDQSSDSRGDFSAVVKGLTPIALPSEGLKENVHSGALPPWLDASEENERNLVNGVTCLKSSSSASAQKGKRKLNPKRVGAAWAEKRRAEIEREKRGEIAANICDANWLPNFGRVWQSGTRRESKREFEKEKHKLNGDKNHPEVASEVSFKIQPYISKRMRIASDKDCELNDYCEGKTTDS